MSTKKYSSSSNLQKILKNGILELSQNPVLSLEEERKRFPVSIGVMFDYITSLTTHWKPKSTCKPLPETDAFREAYRNYRIFFKKNSIQFQFPPQIDDGGNPDPLYHALEGQRIMYVDWKLSHPHVPLQCFHCKYGGGGSLKKKIRKKIPKILSPLSWSIYGPTTHTGRHSFLCGPTVDLPLGAA